MPLQSTQVAPTRVPPPPPTPQRPVAPLSHTPFDDDGYYTLPSSWTLEEQDEKAVHSRGRGNSFGIPAPPTPPPEQDDFSSDGDDDRCAVATWLPVIWRV